MPTTKARLMRRARAYMVLWERKVGLDNELGLTDINKAAEDFYCGLLNIMLGTKLRNLNLLKMDFPAIDLADKAVRLCVQVTSTEGREKIDYTLEKFCENHLERDYDRLIVLVIGKKKNFRKPFPQQNGFPFDPDKDIWDTVRLLLEIQDLDDDRLERVDAYLEKQLGPLEEKPAPLNLPLRTSLDAEHFLGRVAEREQIDDRFADSRVVVLSGPGGIGKTELAIRYGREYADSGRGRAYFALFAGDFQQTVRDSIAPGVPNLSREGKTDQEIYAETMKALRACGKEDLLILDNADQNEISFEQLRRELSVLQMKVLITTRSEEPGIVPVGRLHQAELYEIFRRHGADIPESDMDALIAAVDGHTLTVDLMARSMVKGRRATTAGKLLTALKKRDLSDHSFARINAAYPGGPRQARINEHLRTVFRVAELTGAEQTVLLCATLLPTGGMDPELFCVAFEDHENDALDDLIDKGWLTMQEGLLHIHPVIRIVCREELKPSDENCGPFLNGLQGWYDPKRYDDVSLRQVAELFAVASDDLEDREAYYASLAGYLWLVLAETQKALTCNLRAAEKLEKTQPDTNDLATVYNNVGNTYGDLGDQARALEYQQKALAIREKVLPPEHPDLAHSYNNVGGIYGALGDYARALEYLEKALEIREKILPPEHPDLAQSYNNVGYTYGALGDQARALEYKQKALAIREKVLPPEHPDLAHSYNNVGSTYGALGDYARALEYLEKALAIREKVLPPEHPDLAASYNNVGSTYGNLGDQARALEYKRKALAIWEKVLPPEHPDLAASYNNVGNTYGALGDHARALEYLEKALVIQEKVLPEAHPYNVMCCSNIAVTYARMDDFASAADYAHRALEKAEQSMQGHPKLESYRKLSQTMKLLAMLQEMGLPFDNPFIK